MHIKNNVYLCGEIILHTMTKCFKFGYKIPWEAGLIPQFNSHRVQELSLPSFLLLHISFDTVLSYQKQRWPIKPQRTRVKAGLVGATSDNLTTIRHELSYQSVVCLAKNPQLELATSKRYGTYTQR